MSVNITFLNIKLPSVVAHPEKTDTNYDTCVFMTYETAQEIMSEAMDASESMKGYTSVLISTHDLSFINDEMKHYVMKKGVMERI